MVNSDLTDRKVQARVSMKKFKGTDNVLNVIVPSKVSKASLNQHAIIFLHCLGVNKKYFSDALNKALERVSPKNI